MWRKRRFRRKSEKIDEPTFLETLNKHFDELDAKYSKQYEEIEKKLYCIKRKIRRFNHAPYYHKRNKLINLYIKLQEKKEVLKPEHWQKKFLQDVNPLIEKYEITTKKISFSSNSQIETKIQPISPLHVNLQSLETPNTPQTPSSDILIERTPIKEESCTPEENQIISLEQIEENLTLSQLNEAFLSRHRRQELVHPFQQIEECTNPTCNRQPLLLIQKEARLVCEKCGRYTKHMTSLSNGLHFGDDAENSSQHAYERKKNFKSFLSQFHVSAKEIPVKLIRQMQRAFRDILVRSTIELKSTPAKEWLKKSDEFRKYIDCASRIVNILNRRPVPKFTTAQIDMFVKMFEMTQLPFLHFKASNRQNFLNSCYLMNKMVGIVGLKHYQSSFPLLRHRRTLLFQDQVWAAICSALGWPYEKSI